MGGAPGARGRHCLVTPDGESGTGNRKPMLGKAPVLWAFPIGDDAMNNPGI